MSELIDNRAHRISTMKNIITRLHEGADPEEVRADLTAIVQETDAAEIAAMEQELIRDGMTVEKIQSMCDLHAQVLRDITANPEERPVPPGHPVDTFRLENFALRNRVARIRKIDGELAALPADAPAEELRIDLLTEANKLMDVEKHYSRKEYLLFPHLERYGITGPSQVMWAKDDEARGFLRGFIAALRECQPQAGAIAAVVASVGDQACTSIEEMIYKEENILLPMSLQTLNEEDWGAIFNGSAEIGWCLVEPRQGYQPPVPAEAPPAAEIPVSHAVHFPTGHLSREQLLGLFSVLPVDLTFIDHEDRVAYFSHRPDAIFARNAAIIGRKVQHCHPPKSVDTVERILDDFKSGRQDVAEFWIDFRGRFVHIRYFAVRDERKNYIGTLEVTQDATAIRALTGERRLLAYS